MAARIPRAYRSTGQYFLVFDLVRDGTDRASSQLVGFAIIRLVVGRLAIA